MKAVCKPRVFLQLLDCSAAQAVIFETTTRHDKEVSRPVYTTLIAKVWQLDARTLWARDATVASVSRPYHQGRLFEITSISARFTQTRLIGCL